jgi:transaldolase
MLAAATESWTKEFSVMNPLKSLADHGQAVWLDFLSRGFMATGGRKRLVDNAGLRGVTSNPSIVEQAIGHSDEYDDAIGRMLSAQDRSVGEVFEQLAVEDIKQATDILRPVYDATQGADGLSVSRSRRFSPRTRKARSTKPSGYGARLAART